MTTARLLQSVSHSTAGQLAPVIIFQGANDGTTDETTRLSTFLSTFRHVRIAPNTTVVITKRITLEDDRILEGASDNTSVIMAGSAITQDTAGTAISNQVHRCMFLVGDNCVFRNLKFDGNDFYAGGLYLYSTDRVLIEDCVFTDMTAGTAATSGVAISCDIDTGTRINRCKFYRTYYAVENWRSDDCIVTNCHSDVSFAGFWTSIATRVKYIDCTVSNCEDVGFDFEGGSDCLVQGGTVSRCKNGELALFDGASSDADINLQFVGVKVTREANYTKLDGTTDTITAANGAFYVNTLSASSKDCGVRNCEFWIESGIAFSFPSLSATTTAATDRTLFFSDNVIHHQSTAALFKVNDRARGAICTGNRWDITAVPGTSAEWKNAGRGDFSENTFAVAAGLTLTTPLVWFYETDGSGANIPSYVSRNRFINAGQYAVRFTAAAGQSRVWRVKENDFSTGCELLGGVTQDSGTQPIYINQRLLIKPADKATAGASEVIDLANATDFPMFNGTLGIGGPTARIELQVAESTNFNVYDFTLTATSGTTTLRQTDGTSTGSGSGRTGSTALFLASQSGTSLTFTKASGASVSIRAMATVNSLTQ